MKLLALDAATEACSAALLIDGAVSERYEVIGRGHAQCLLPMADELMRAAGITASGLDAVAFGRGPGGFTGLRIAAGLAQGLAAGAGIPVLPVSNLAAVAAGAERTSGASRILACLDARMGQVYWGAFVAEDGRLLARGEERLSHPDELTLPAGGGWYGAGPGFGAYPVLAPRLGSQLAGLDVALLPRAADIARLAAADFQAGRAVAAAAALPVYLRDDVVHRR